MKSTVSNQHTYPYVRFGNRVGQYQGDFVPNGKHKHTLLIGKNMAKLKPATITSLMKDATLQKLLKDLGYDWFGHRE